MSSLLALTLGPATPTSPPSESKPSPSACSAWSLLSVFPDFRPSASACSAWSPGEWLGSVVPSSAPGGFEGTAECMYACSLAALASAMSEERLMRKQRACSSSATSSRDREDATPACKGYQTLSAYLCLHFNVPLHYVVLCLKRHAHTHTQLYSKVLRLSWFMCCFQAIMQTAGPISTLQSFPSHQDIES